MCSSSSPLLLFVPAAFDFFAALLCTMFLAAAALRLLSVAFAPREADRAVRVGDHELPIYTIICPLYREAGVVDNLVAAIRALDYPPEKLDVKLVLEADDHETRSALRSSNWGRPSRSSPRRHSVRGPNPKRSTRRCRLRAAHSLSSMMPKTCRNPISSGALSRCLRHPTIGSPACRRH